MRSGKDFETRTSIWKVREPGCYGLRDQSRAKMAKSSRAMKRARKSEGKKVSPFYLPVPTSVVSAATRVTTFYACYCGKIDFINSR